MATPINTRILLRNDTLENWTGSSLVLGKGEVAIATINDTLAEVRVGTGSSTWATARKLNIGTDQVSGLTEMISALVGDGAKKYQVVSVDTNSWKLQQAALSGGQWSDVDGSTWSVDFTDINNAITGLTANISYLSGQIDATNATLNTVSSDYLKAADKTELSNALTALDAAKLAKTDFAALSNEIGLSAANAANPVVTKDDIKDLAGAMHFRGAVSNPSEITDPKAGDVVIVISTSKEYVYNGTQWIELGDEALYATKAEVSAVSAELTSDIAELTANDQYLSGQISTITSTYATKAELTGAADALSTDYNAKIEVLSNAISNITGDYATKAEVAGISAELTGDIAGLTADVGYLSGQIDTTNTTLNTVSSDYLKAADKTALETLVGTTSAETLVSANAYTDTKFAGLSDYYTKSEVNAISTALSTDYVGKIATAKSEVIGEATDLSSADTINGAKAYAKDYADGAVAALSIDDYIKHGQVVDTDLSGFFILNCGASTLRKGEPTSPIA